MSIIYLVISSENLEDDSEYIEVCRAFKHEQDARAFRNRLELLFAADPWANDTQFSVKKVQYSEAAYIPPTMEGATA